MTSPEGGLAGRIDQALTQLSRQHLFTIANHFQHGIDLLDDVAERQQVARLMWRAGQQAKLAVAFVVAHNYCQLARHLLSERSWQDDYQFTLDLHNEAAEVAACAEQFEQMTALLRIIRQQARTPAEQISSYLIEIQALQRQREVDAALDCYLAGLAMLGVHWSRDASQVQVGAAFVSLQALLFRHPPKTLYDLPPMTDPHQLAILRLITATYPLLFLISPQYLFPLSLFKQIALSIRHGYSIHAAGCFMAYGTIVLLGLGQMRHAERFQALARHVLSKPPASAEDMGTTHSLMALTEALTAHHTKPLSETSDMLALAYQDATQYGQWVWAAYAGTLHFEYRFMHGDMPLSEIIELGLQYDQTLERWGLSDITAQFRASLQWVVQWSALNERADERPYLLHGQYFDETVGLPAYEAEKNENLLGSIYFAKLMLAYSFGAYAEAASYVPRMMKFQAAFQGLMQDVMAHFYAALALLAVYPSQNRLRQLRTRQQVNGYLGKLKQWAKYAPQNYRHYVLFVEAEFARVRGKPFEAHRGYQQAAELAQTHGFWRDTALIHERWASFWQAEGQDDYFQLHLRHAYHFYGRWEATVKIKQLEKQYPWLKASELSPHSQTTITSDGSVFSRSSELVDLASLFKANQVITSQIGIKDLLEQVMKLVIENAGADRGVLFLPRSGQWYLQAEATTDHVAVLQGQLLTELSENDFPVPLLSYVIRTQERLVLNRVQTLGDFTQLPYVLTQTPQAVLTLPLLNKGYSSGLLYLENRLSPDVFTVERLSLLNLLASQIAISLDNAWVYDNLERLVSDRTRQLQTVARFSEQISAILSVEELLQTVVDQVQSQFSYYHAHIYLLDDSRTDLLMVAGTGPAGQMMKRVGHHIPFGRVQSLVAQAARTGKVVLVDDVRQNPNWLPNKLLPYTQAELAVPISRQAEIVGVLDVQSDQLAGLDQGDAYLLRSLANQIGVALNNARLYQNLARLNDDKDKFFSIVAHDLKGPFQPVLGNAELLVEMSDLLPPDEIKSIAQSIHRSGEKVLALLDDLLQWARIQMGRMPVQPEHVRLADVAQQTVELLQGMAQTKQIGLSHTIPAHLSAQADAHMVETIIRNLTNNALKFTPSGGQVTISARPDGEFVEVSVTDTGVGMSEEVRLKLFQIGVHHSTSGTANESGTGLGLIMCQEMVQLNGGRIWVDSEIGRGSAFRFTLPNRGIS